VAYREESGVVVRSAPSSRAAGYLSAVAAEEAQRSIRSAHRTHPICPELDCVRHWLTPDAVSAIERRAIALGVGADRVLVSAGIVSEEEYSRALAFALQLPFALLDCPPPDPSPIPNEQLMDAAATGVLSFTADRMSFSIVAPRGLAARRLIALLASRPEMRSRVLITSGARLRSFANRHGAAAIERQAVDSLRQQAPSLSAAPRRWRPGNAMVTAGAGVALAAGLVPAVVIGLAQIALTAMFLGWTGLRILAAIKAPPALPPPLFRVRDELLPTYTVIVPLYREAAALAGLVDALQALDYPREKLDVKIVLEWDDLSTRLALAMMQPGPPFEIILVPPGRPRTKPKALNVALPFARGAFTVVYDAEDRPEPDQLRRVLNIFLAERADLACVQASLSIDNTADSWLARLFTVEYAGQFDVLLPGLVALGLPIPLGGSSNHFQTAVLRKIGAWDPFNVTEDADLGTRLARLGYRAATIASTTYEEAPAKLKPWLKQRTRWFKGWMQTYLVHMRDPRQLARDLGVAGFMTFHLVLAGTVLAALVQPVLIVFLLMLLVADVPLLAATDNLAGQVLVWAHGAALIGGYGASGVLGYIGLKRRRLLSTAWVLMLLPLYWLLLSLAALRAVIELAFDPYRWEKTEHGLARTSRRLGSG
jgi:cellulose synthase/poly-beta-1,6-N-acetylglucosamine synthase-like glycosyltransferase